MAYNEKARAAQYRWRAKNPEKWKALKKQSYRRHHPEKKPADPMAGRAWHLKRYYNLTVEEYQRMWDTQGGVCAICGEPETKTSRNGVVKSLSVDHDHDTGEVRALLCQTCNTGIGNLKDDPSLMRRAAEYMELWGG